MSGKKVCSFQDRIAELVASSGKSQSALAADFGVAKQTLSAWITGQNSPRAPVVSALAEYFHVSVPWLMGYDVPREPPASMVGYSQYISEVAPPVPPADQPKTIEARILARGIDKLPQAQREQALAVVRAMFAKYANFFDKESDDET